MKNIENEKELHVVVGPEGSPVAYVPTSCMWGLVEYLSFQRVSVTYHFERDHFDVVFPKSDIATAERLLEDWAHGRALAAGHEEH